MEVYLRLTILEAWDMLEMLADKIRQSFEFPERQKEWQIIYDRLQAYYDAVGGKANGKF